ncbi:GTP cyclohydrolase I FolE [bacterium SCSIO 12643]|nr:GTP cyclohydrolase I FolE [bacterium SCSIO 12643]
MKYKENLMDEMGDAHASSSSETPLRADAFDLQPKEKKEIIEKHFFKIMETLGLDMTDDSLKGTPHRVSKMFVNEIFSGLDPANKPKMSTFSNKYDYNKMLVEKHISVNSTCEHHFLPIVGKAHVAYISTGKVIGLSKINRIVDYYSRRPQVQERLTIQIMEELKKALDTDSVAVIIEAQHLCVTSRGITDRTSTTVTVEYSGEFKKEDIKAEFLKYIGDGIN